MLLTNCKSDSKTRDSFMAPLPVFGTQPAEPKSVLSSFSKLAKKNNLSLIIGPPKLTPYCFCSNLGFTTDSPFILPPVKLSFKKNHKQFL